MFTYLGRIGIDTGLWACGGCGAVVADRDAHLAFHERLAQLEEPHAAA